MSVFIRRFLNQVGNDVLLEIEAVDILDLAPPASITGIGTGTAICTGEYEDGPFSTGGNANGITDPKGAVEVTGTSDFVATFGELGYRYAGVPGNNPSARKRRVDGAIIDEFWNGNAFVQLNGKRFRRLLCLRVDTSIGAVQFSREAYVTGAAAFAYNLEPGQILALDIGAGPVSATFTATAATVTSGAGVYPTLFVGGETLTLGYDAAPNFVVTFLPADQTKLQVIARINLYAGFTFATDGGGALIALTGLQRGSGGQVRVVAASAGVLVTTGFLVATTSGTGNVSNIDAVTFNEVRAVVQAAVAGSSMEQDSGGRLRASKNFTTATDYIQVGTATTAAALGFAVDAQGSNDGIANYRSTAETFPTVAATGPLTLGVDAEANFNATITNGFSQAQVITAINAAAGFTMASAIDATHTLLRGRANGGEVRVVGASATILSDLGLVIKTIDEAPIQTGKIPAGTVVRNAANDRVFVTMQSVTIDAPNIIGGVYVANAGPYSVKVRHALDDGSGASATAGSIVVVDSPPDLGSFDVVNPLTLTAALSELAIDVQYTAAIDTTTDLNTVAREANVIWSSRQSNVIRRKLKDNVITASSIGMFGRMCPIRPPIGSTRATALSKLAEPGVGAYRDQRVIYNFPQVRTFVPIIAQRGLAGGTGFSADGLIDVGADGFMASILSQLAPEENPGQLTSFTGGAVSLESSPNAQGYTIDDYIQFRANGISAPRMDDGTMIFQSGVTSVDPGIFPNFRNIARRRMADFIEDSLARRGKAFGKKLSTLARRKAITAEFSGFLTGLQSVDNPSLQRINSFSIDDKSGNTPETLGLGIYRLIIKVRTLASIDALVPESTIGELVEIDIPLA